MPRRPTYTKEQNDALRAALRAAMRRRGWEQRAVAKDMGRSQAAISSFLCGHSSAAADFAASIARLAGDTLDEIFSCLPDPDGADLGASDFGSRLRAIRVSRGWSQAQLATRSGVSQLSISRLERGAVAKPNHFGLVGLARALETSVDELTGQTPRPPNPAPVEPERELSPLERAVFRAADPAKHSVEAFDLARLTVRQTGTALEAFSPNSIARLLLDVAAEVIRTRDARTPTMVLARVVGRLLCAVEEGSRELPVDESSAA